MHQFSAHAKSVGGAPPLDTWGKIIEYLQRNHPEYLPVRFLPAGDDNLIPVEVRPDVQSLTTILYYGDGGMMVSG